MPTTRINNETTVEDFFIYLENRMKLDRGDLNTIRDYLAKKIVRVVRKLPLVVAGLAWVFNCLKAYSRLEPS